MRKHHHSPVSLRPSCAPLLQNGKTTIKCPKIQRLVTPQVLQRKRQRAAIKKERIVRKKTEAAEYHKLLVQRLKEQVGAAARGWGRGWGRAELAVLRWQSHGGAEVAAPRWYPGGSAEVAPCW